MFIKGFLKKTAACVVSLALLLSAVPALPSSASAAAGNTAQTDGRLTNGFITSDTLRIEDGVIYGVEEYTAVDQLVRMFNVADLDLRVLGKNGNELDGWDLVAEGDSVQYVVDGEILEQLTVGSLEEYVQPVYTTSVPDGSDASEDVTITSSKPVYFDVSYIGYVDDFDGWYDHEGTELILSMDASYTVKVYPSMFSSQLLFTYRVNIRKPSNPPVLTPSVPDWGNSDQDVIITADREVTFQVAYTNFDDDTFETYEVTGKTLTLDRNGDYSVKVLGANGWKWEYNVFINKKLAAANSGGLITSDTLRIENGVIYGVEEYTTLNRLLSMFNPVPEGKLQLVSPRGEVRWGPVYEGDFVQYIANDEVAEQLTIGPLEAYVPPEITVSVPDGGVTTEDVIITASKEVEYHVEYLPADELMRQSDIITVHVPVLPETIHMINKESISKMKDGVVIVNTSRGETVCSEDLADALKSGKVHAAGLDVFEGEGGHHMHAPFIGLEQAIITPHVASSTFETYNAMIEKSVEIIDRFRKQEDLTGWILNPAYKEYLRT